MSIYKNTNGKWYYNFMLNGDRKHGVCKGCFEKSEALEYEADMKRELSLIQRGKITKTEKTITIKRMFDLYLRYSEINKVAKSFVDDKHKAEVMLDFFGSNYTIYTITPSKIEDFKKYIVITKKLSKATFNRYFSALSKAYNLIIIEDRLNIQNPCKAVGKLQEDNCKIRYLTEDEENRLIPELPDYLKPIVVCALTTGLRYSNIVNLRWEAIDFKYNFVEILKQENKGHKKIQLPLSSKLKAELEKIGVQDEGFVFVSHRTGHAYKKLQEGFSQACKRAKVKNFRFHDLRHTVATRLVANGADLMTVKEFMAHSSLATTQRYMHPTPENMKKAVDILDGF
jgi:integrase